MSDFSIVRDGALIGDGCSAFEHSALDQSVLYPADMSGLPTSTPNPANLRRKSRRSWFETTPKGFKFDIAVEKPNDAKKHKRKSDTVEVLTLSHFSSAPRLGFGTFKVGQEKTCTLLLRNPHDYEQSVKVEKVPEKKHFSVSCKQFTVGPEESYPLEITWSPKEAGGVREMVMMQVDRAYRVQAYVFGTVTAPPPQKKKKKRVGLLATKAAGPFSVIHTTSLANINQQYSPEKKTVKQITKQTVDKKPLQQSKQPNSKSLKPSGPAIHTKSNIQMHHASNKGRKSGEGRRRSLRLSDKCQSAVEENKQSECSAKDAENINPVTLTVQDQIGERAETRKSSERKTSLPKPKIVENIPRKKMRRSNTYSQVSELGLVIPIIQGDAVKGLKDTSLMNIEDCNISGIKVLEESSNNDPEPSFLEPKEESCIRRTWKENAYATNTLDPSFLDEGNNNDMSNDHNNSIEPSFIKEETKTLLKSKIMSDSLEPSFLECKITTVIKNTVLNAVQNCETFHDSLEVENQPVDDPSFLLAENIKPEKPRRSRRKRSGIIEVEYNDESTGVKLLRGAKRNSARKIVSPETFIKEVGPKTENRLESVVDEHKPLNDSVGQSTLLEQLKSLKSFVHDKSVEIERSGNESVCDIEDKDSVKELQRRETFVKHQMSPLFSVPGSVDNIRRGTFVAESTKLKLLETQKPSEASPRRTTFTIIKGSGKPKKPLESKVKDSVFALTEEEEIDTESEEKTHVNEHMIQKDNEQGQLKRLFSADSLENESFEKQTKSPEQIFVEQKEELSRRATLTVTKSRPSDALLEYAQRSAAAVKCLVNTSVMNPQEETIPEDETEKDDLIEVEEKISPPKPSQNSTFEVPLENSIVVAKDSSFPTTPYHLLPTSPQLDHSRRSTHVVVKPKVLDLSGVNGKQLFMKQDDNKLENYNEVEQKEESFLNVENIIQKEIEPKIDSGMEKKSDNLSHEKIVTGSYEVCQNNVDGNEGPGSNLRRRKLSARRSVTSLGEHSAEKSNASPNVTEAEICRESIKENISAENKKDMVDGEKDGDKQSATAEQLFFVPFDNKNEPEESARPRTKRPDPRQFLKKRTNPVTQEDDRRSKRPKSETAVNKKKVNVPESGSKLGQTSKVVESAAPSVRITRQTVKNVGTARSTGIRQTQKPAGTVKGLSTSKLILTKKSKSAIPKHPLPFAAKNMFYDERWMEKQERGFVSWLNFILTPPEEHQGSDVKIKVDAGKLTLDVEKGRNKLAPTNEILSFRTYSAHRKLNRLRKSACRLFQSESVRKVMQKVEEEVESKRLLVRKDKMLHADVGAKQKILDMLLSYNPLWLRVGLETIYGEVVPLQCNTDVYGLSQFIVVRVLASPDIADEFAHPTVPHLYREGYAEATAQHTLKRFMMLVYFLDQAKQQRLIEHNPCLFCKNSDIKTSKDMLLQFSRDYLSGEGDITRHLGYLGYKVTYSQTTLDEFDFAVKSLGTDLRDGLRLARVMEVICNKAELSRTSLRAPAISRLQKVHNVEVVFKALEQQGIDTGKISTRDVVDGHREKTLSLLWMIILHYQVATVIDVEQIKEEVQILERSLRLKKQFNKFVKLECDVTSKKRESEGPDLHTQDERLDLLMKWCRAVCAFYDIKVENFTVSFSDGRALCHILHYYHPGLLPLSQIQHETTVTHLESMEKNCEQNMNCSLNDSVSSSAVFGDVADPAVYEQLLANEKENFKLQSEKVKELGGIPLLLRWSDMSNTIPDEKVVVTYLMYLCARLLDIRHESRAARVIQHAWRAYRLKKLQAEYEVKVKSILVLQRAVRKFLLVRREQHQQSAALCIQRMWRGHQARCETRKLRQKQILQQQEHAATIIQNNVERYLHRRRYLQMKATVIHLQAHCRGYLVRRKFHTAAVTIQAIYRGYVKHKEFQKLKNATVYCQRRYRAIEQSKRERSHFLQVRNAALSIQATYKSYILHKQYTKMRQSAIKIQAVVRGYHQRQQYQKIRTAVVMIQRRIRATLLSWQQRHEFLKVRHAAIVVQSAFRKKRERQHFKDIRQAAILIQSRLRGYVQQKKYQRLVSAACTIQKYYRARTLGISCRRQFLISKGAVILIQSRVRGFVQQIKYQRLLTATLRIQQYYRARSAGISCRRQFLISKGAAITIQAWYKGYQARKQLKLETESAITIQSVYKGYSQRKRYLEVKNAIVVCQRRRKALLIGRKVRSQYVCTRKAIIHIQAAVRAWICRREFIRLQAERLQYQQQNQAATTIQKWLHGAALTKTARRAFLIKRGAAISIQAYVKMFLIRKLYLQLLISKRAAITIQALYKGYQVRKQLKLETESAITIQSVYRGYSQRKRYLEVKNAIVVCQRHRKAVLIGRKIRSQYVCTRKAIIHIQAAVRALICRREFIRLQAERLQYQQQNQAATTIQKWLRGAVLTRTARRAFLIKRGAAITIQAFVKMFLIRKLYLQLLISKRAAITIQACYKGYQARKQLKLETESAITIQSVYKGYSQRKRYLEVKNAIVVCQRRRKALLIGRKVRSQYVCTRKAIIHMQAAVRAWICRREFIRLQAERHQYKQQNQAATTIQKWVRGAALTKTARRAFLIKRGAAITIQAYVKMFLIRKLYLQLLLSKRAAITIQACYKGYQVRKQLKLETESAITIQSVYRGYSQRKRYLEVKNAIVVCQRRRKAVLIGRKIQSQYVCTRKAIIHIQAAIRAWICRREFIRLQAERLQYQQQNQAATTIQKWLRGAALTKTARRAFLIKRGAAITIQAFVKMFPIRKLYLQLLTSKRAAITIQACYKGYQARKQLKLETESAITIQSVYKGYSQRKRYLEVKNAIVVCQRRRKALLVGRKIRSQYVCTRKAIIHIQAAIRAWICRGEFIRLQKERLQYQQQNKAATAIQKWVWGAALTKTARRAFLIKRGAAITIQAYVKMFLIRKLYLQLLISKRAAITIQACYKGYQARKQLKLETESAITIQSVYKGYSQRKRYLEVKNAIVVCQRRRKAVLIGRKILSQYVCTRKAIIHMQAAIRAWICRREFIRLQTERLEYQQQNQAANTIQKWLRGAILTKTARRAFLIKRGAAFTIQAYVKMFLIRKLYLQLLISKRAAITIQACYKGYQVRKQLKLETESAITIQSVYKGYSQRKRYLEVKNAIVVCQRRRKALLIGRKVRSQYVCTRKAIIHIQAAIRALICRREFIRLQAERLQYQQQNQAATTIQKWLRGAVLTKTARRSFLIKRGAAITIQAYVKMFLARKLYLQTVVTEVTRANKAAIVIQRYYRNRKILRVAEERVHSVLLIQRWMRSKLQRLHFIQQRQCVIRLQSCVRTWLARRDKAARVIQRAVRPWLVSADTRKQHKAAVKIQAMWKGYYKRKTIKSRRLTLLRKRVQESAASVTEDKKLCNRTSSALDFLLRYKQLSQVFEALQHLEVASRLSWVCCERMVEARAIPVFYRLVQGCNRSLPHIEIIKYTIDILTNLAKYEKTRPAVYEADGSVQVLVNLMQIYREKGQIFTKTCTLFGILALETPCKMSVVEDNKILEKLYSIQSLTARKHKLVETQRVTRARMNASSLNATFMVQTPMEKVKPGWSLHKDKMNDIVDPLKAINFVFKNLGIQAKAR